LIGGVPQAEGQTSSPQVSVIRTHHNANRKHDR